MRRTRSKNILSAKTFNVRTFFFSEMKVMCSIFRFIIRLVYSWTLLIVLCLVNTWGQRYCCLQDFVYVYMLLWENDVYLVIYRASMAWRTSCYQCGSVNKHIFMSVILQTLSRFINKILLALSLYNDVLWCFYTMTGLITPCTGHDRIDEAIEW